MNKQTNKKYSHKTNIVEYICAFNHAYIKISWVFINRNDKFIDVSEDFVSLRRLEGPAGFL